MYNRKAENNGLEMLSERYIQHIMLENKSVATITNVKFSLKHFFRFLHGQGIHEITKVTEETINGYKRKLHNHKLENGANYAVETIRNRLKILRVFFKFLNKNGIIYSNPAINLEIPKREVKIPRVIMTIDEVKLIMKAPDWRSASGYRDRAILELLYSTGVRNSELRQLKTDDVNLENGLLRITRGKGDKMRVVPLSKLTSRWVKSYIKKIRKIFVNKKHDAGYLFLTFRGDRLSSCILNNIIKKYRQKCGITKPITAHCFRHSIATHLLERNMDIRYIQEFLGHSKIDSTQIYTRVVISGLQEKYKKYHPRETVRLTTIPRFKTGKHIMFTQTNSEEIKKDETTRLR